MKIALIMQRIEPWRGGAETSLMQYAAELGRRGCEVHIYTGSSGLAPGGVAVRRVPCRARLRSRRTLWFVRGAAAAVGEGTFDVVHAVTPCPGADVYQPRGGTACETGLRNVEACTTQVGRWAKRASLACNLQHRLMRRLEERLCGSADGPVIVAVSEYVARQLREHYGLTPPRVQVVLNGVDVARFDAGQSQQQRRQVRQRLGLRGEAVAALLVAHNFKLKGLASAIRALAGVVDRGNDSARLIVVGRDDPRPYRRLAKRLGVGGAVLFAGAAPEPSEFFWGADLLVHPTFYDPCSRVVLEALACGLPVITTRQNGAAEVITEGREGYVIDSGHEIAALTDRWCELMDPQVRRRCGEHALEKRHQVSMERHVEQMLEVYRRVCAAKDRRAGGGDAPMVAAEVKGNGAGL
jgi:UDP-glucose:(heptosyl)LPS alpha-1,3-glucosyltransferase